MLLSVRANILLESTQLHDAGGTPYYNAFFSAGTGPIYLDDVACTLSASQLLECSSSPVLVHDCDHHADAGVGCEGMFFNLITKKTSEI